MPKIKVFKIALTFFLISTAASCSHKELIGELTSNTPAYRHEFDFSDPEKIRKHLKANDLKVQANQEKLIQILIAYSNLVKAQDQGRITLGPQSKTSIAVSSFCAASEKAIPEQHELFKWTKGAPKISLIKEVLDLYTKKQGSNLQKFQELIWNLANETNYDEYPQSLKELIIQASPSAPLTLPSSLKSQVIDEFVSPEIKNTISFVKGKYYTFSDFKKVLEGKRSNLPSSKSNLISKLPEVDISATTISNGYESQAIAFYNVSNNVQTFKITDYYLRPLREDVQPIVLASVFPFGDEIQKILEEHALKILGYIGSQYPTLSPQEKILVKQNPIESAIVYYNAFKAERSANNFFPESVANGPSDAFRHFTWAGLLTRDLGEDAARKFTSTHELSTGQSSREKIMDEFNNERGIHTAKQLLKNGNFGDAELYQRAIEEIRNGKLKILNHENRKSKY